MKTSMAAIGLTLFLGVAGVATAGPIPYPNVGVQNPVTYTFVAASTGDITAYFYGSTAAYVNDLSMLVNGVSTGVEGLNNHGSPYGLALDLGSVNAGDTLVFQLNNLSPGGIGPWYSDKTMNSDGVNHVYSTDYAGDLVVPAGVFVAFEDLPNGGDFNYNDEDFVFTNVAIATPAPEPATLMLVGLGLIALVVVQRKIAKRAKATA
ncbi:MAG TPA: DUF4114 domain-containing protein [Steroidobacteraceae bacterium]|nr:DUF4114 domain-containing protein [Steroidobacteraceae bacterium]